MRVVFTSVAECDLEDIGDYIAVDSPQRALSFVQELRARCQELVDNPYRGTLRARYGENVRAVVYGKYLLFYAVEAERIVILRIVHGARDVAKLKLGRW